APLGVIPVLFPAARITARRLQVSFRIRTNPHILPCRRNRERPNAFEIGSIADGTVIRALVTEAERDHLTPDAGTIVGDVMKTGGGRRFRGPKGSAPLR